MSPHVCPAPPRRWVRAGVGMLLLAMLGWSGWRAYDFRCAVREAEAAGFSFDQSPDPGDRIFEDWLTDFRAVTRSEGSRTLVLPIECDLAQHQTLLLRLRPTILVAPRCRNVSAIRGLTELHSLGLSGQDVKDLAPLAGLTQLQMLELTGCPGVVDLAPLQGLTQLQMLELFDCPGVADLTPLRSLAQLQWLNLDGCKGVTDLAPLQGLTQLMTLELIGCMGLSAEAVAAFRKSHPKTEIQGP